MKNGQVILKILIILLFLNSDFVYAQTAQDYIHLGNLSGREKRFKEAILNYTKAIKSDPHIANAYYNRGYVYFELKKYKLALHDFGLAIGINPQYTAAYHMMGVTYFIRKRYPEAIVCYSKAIELDPNNLKFYISRLSAYFKTGDGDKAWKDVLKIQQLGGSVNPSIINILKNSKYRE